MTTDNKTLADVQPGGRVRLGDDLLPCPFCGGGDAEMQQCQAEHYVQCLECEGATALFSSRREARELWNRRAALSAQPSPGGKPDVLAALIEACEDMRAASEECDNGEGLAHVVPYHQWNEFLAKLDDADQALSARQPVATLIHPHSGQPRDYRDVKSDPEGFLCVPAGPIFAAQPSPGGQGDGWDIAELVRTDLDRQSCLDAYMRIAMESVVKHLAARQPVGEDHLREAIATVCEGWTLPADARKILEKAMWEYVPPAQAVGEPVVTAEMLAAADKYHDSDEYRSGNFSDSHTNAACYRAMAAAAPPAQAVDLGKFHALAEFGEEFAFSAEKQPQSRVIYAQARRLLALIDSQAAGN